MKSLNKVLDIIETLAESGSAGIRELSTRTGFPPPSVHRMVGPLLSRRYLKQDPVTKRLSLSVKFLELGARVRRQFNLLSLARPYLEDLVRETKESVNLAMREGDEVVYLDHVRSTHSMLQLFTMPGARVPLYCTGVGKAFLSQWTQQELGAYIRRTRMIAHTPHTFTDCDLLLQEILKIREQGYSVDNEEMERGVRCLAALVFDHSGAPVAAVSISGAAMRMTEDRIDEFAQAVRRCAGSLSKELGFQLNP